MGRKETPDDGKTPSEVKDIMDAVTQQPADPAPAETGMSLSDVQAQLQAIRELAEAQSRMAAAIESLALRGAASPGGASDEMTQMMGALTAAMGRFAEAQIDGAKLLAAEQKRAHRPSNEIVPGISVFNRRGTNLPEGATGPRKPPLKCPMLIPWYVEWESITREEAELCNLLEAGEYTIKRTDGSKVRLTVKLEMKVDNVTPSRLLANHDTAFNNDNHKITPPMPDYLRQMLRQHRPEVAMLAAKVMTDEEEEALIEAEVLTVSGPGL